MFSTEIINGLLPEHHNLSCSMQVEECKDK